MVQLFYGTFLTEGIHEGKVEEIVTFKSPVCVVGG